MKILAVNQLRNMSADRNNTNYLWCYYISDENGIYTNFIKQIVNNDKEKNIYVILDIYDNYLELDGFTAVFILDSEPSPYKTIFY